MIDCTNEQNCSDTNSLKKSDQKAKIVSSQSAVNEVTTTQHLLLKLQRKTLAFDFYKHLVFGDTALSDNSQLSQWLDKHEHCMAAVFLNEIEKSKWSQYYAKFRKQWLREHEKDSDAEYTIRIEQFLKGVVALSLQFKKESENRELLRNGLNLYFDQVAPRLARNAQHSHHYFVHKYLQARQSGSSHAASFQNLLCSMDAGNQVLMEQKVFKEPFLFCKQNGNALLPTDDANGSEEQEDVANK